MYFYGARWYDSSLGRFTSPDSVIPQASQGTQAWDRYAGLNNNPVVHNDPSGHDVGCSKADPKCNDQNSDGVPSNPHQNYIVPPVSGGNCDDSSYVKCLYAGQLFKIEGTMDVDTGKFDLMTTAIFLDVKKRGGSIDRTSYDTPFWDAYGAAPGTACFSGNCYKRQEVNYVAQGMLSAAVEKNLWIGENIIVGGWKAWNHFTDPATYPSSKPSSGTLHWFEVGFSTYNAMNKIYQDIINKYQ